MGDLQVRSNAAEVARAFARMASELSDLEGPNRAAGDIIAAAPQPHRSGLLAASVRADVTAGGVTVAGLVRYWSFVEWGAPNANVKAQHPLRTQLVDRQQDIIDVYVSYAASVAADVGD